MVENLQGKAMQCGGERRGDALLLCFFVYIKLLKVKGGVLWAQASSLAFLVIQPKSDCPLWSPHSHANFKLVPTQKTCRFVWTFLGLLTILFYFKKNDRERERGKGPERGYNSIWVLYWNGWSWDASRIPRRVLPRMSHDWLIKK